MPRLIEKLIGTITKPVIDRSPEAVSDFTDQARQRLGSFLTSVGELLSGTKEDKDTIRKRSIEKFREYLEENISNENWESNCPSCKKMQEFKKQADEEGWDYQFEEMLQLFNEIITPHRQKESKERRKEYYLKDAEGQDSLLHVVESQQFTKEEIEHFTDLAIIIEKYDLFIQYVDRNLKLKVKLPEEVISAAQDIQTRFLDLLKGKRILNLFAQPSTRTHISFAAAAIMFGVSPMDIKDVNLSSMQKGETLKDTILTFAQAYHLCIMRTNYEYSSNIGALCQKNINNDVPEMATMNGGEGTRQHPTQALLDLTTIKKYLGLNSLEEMNGKTVTVVGDLKFGRTVKSLVYSLAKVAPDVNINFVSPADLKIPNDFRKHIENKGINFQETEDLRSCLGKSDVVYMTRVQKEWFKQAGKLELYEQIKDLYKLNDEDFDRIGEETDENYGIVLHPLPRVNELAWTTDQSPKSHIWDQVRAGTYTRAGLMLEIFGKTGEFNKIIKEDKLPDNVEFLTKLKVNALITTGQSIPHKELLAT